jgi:hypothetical protein
MLRVHFTLAGEDAAKDVDLAPRDLPIAPNVGEVVVVGDSRHVVVDRIWFLHRGGATVVIVRLR